MLRTGIHIKVCAVWDTVGSIGMPRMAIFSQPGPKHLEFVNSELCPNIDNAFQAIALHEHRRHFRPILWQSAHKTQTLKQCWFPGYHGDVGGGRSDGALAHFALIWMMDQLKNFLNFDVNHLWIPAVEPYDVIPKDSGNGIRRTYIDNDDAKRATGKIRLEEYDKPALTIWVVTVVDTKRSIHTAGGDHVREPCRHFWDQKGIRAVEQPDAGSSKEKLHFSVRILLAKNVIDVPPCLTVSKCEPVNAGIQWTIEPLDGLWEKKYVMEEDEVTDDEFKLLHKWLECVESHLSSVAEWGKTRNEIRRAIPTSLSVLMTQTLGWISPGYHPKYTPNKNHTARGFSKFLSK